MSVNLTDKNDYTPLHVSAQFGHLKTTKALVERGAAINYINIYGNTPLMEAIYSCKLEIFRYLTEIDADINIRDAQKQHCSSLSCSIGKCEYYRVITG